MMANEIKVSSRLQVIKGNVDERDDDDSFNVDQTGASAATPGFRSVGTSELSETFSELDTMGWCKIKNNDATDWVDFGFSTGVYGIRIYPAESALFRFKPGTALYIVNRY